MAQDRSGWRSCRTGLEDVTEARVAEDERGEGHVWKTVLRTVVAVQLQISHTSAVCVREYSDESKTLIYTDVSPLVNNCDLVCHLWQRSIIRWVAAFQGQGQGVCVCVCVCVCQGEGEDFQLLHESVAKKK